MSSDVFQRHRELSKKLEQEWKLEIDKAEQQISSYEKQLKRNLLAKANAELNLMEDAMRRKNLIQAEYHKLMADVYLSMTD